MGLEQFCLWLNDTQVGTAIRESLWVFPIIETIHVLGIALLSGTAAIFDLRLLGWAMRNDTVSAVAKRVLPLVWTGALVMFLTGALLFWAGAAKLYFNPAFRIKLLLLVFAGLNPLFFHYGIYRKITEWDSLAITPVRARIAATASLTLWAAIILAGRAIAYL